MDIWRKKLHDLEKEPIEEQARFFQQRFVFSISPSAVQDIKQKFIQALKSDDGKETMSPAAAAGFLQGLGLTRTALQRKAELNDVDIDGDGRTSFIEYLLLHFKIEILEEYFKRRNMEPDVSMENHGVGLTGVGDRLVEELFAIPVGLDPELESLMKQFSIEHKRREDEIAELRAVVEQGGVKGMAAKSKLDNVLNEDQSGMHMVEAKIATAIKKAHKKAKDEMEAKAKEKAAEIAAADAARKMKH